MASEATTAETQQDLPRRVADLERELGDAQQREAATAELLQVINRPQFALQSVFEAMAQSAMRLCEGEFAFVLRFDGELLRFAASYGLTQEGSAALQDSLPRPAGYDTANGRAVLRRAVVQIPDVRADLDYGALGVAEKATYRSLIAVPLLRDGDPIGGITVGRARVGPFSEGQIRLLRTFADQAVIAPADRAAHFPRFPSLAAFERRPGGRSACGELCDRGRHPKPVTKGGHPIDALGTSLLPPQSCRRCCGAKEFMVSGVQHV